MVLTRVPVVAGLAYIERLRELPTHFIATLVVRPDQRYFPHAIAVTVDGHTVGYVAPEVARSYYAVVSGAGDRVITCAARRASSSDHETSGVELLLDCSALAGA